MNNWGLRRFAGKPYCLTGAVLCFSGCLGELIQPNILNNEPRHCSFLKIRKHQASYKNNEIRLRESRARTRPNSVVLSASIVNAEIHSLFIFHYSLKSKANAELPYPPEKKSASDFSRACRMTPNEVKQSFTKWATLAKQAKRVLRVKLKIGNPQTIKSKNSSRGVAALLRRVKTGFRGRLCFGAAM